MVLSYGSVPVMLAVNAPNVKAKEFGGTDKGDDRAALLEGLRKPFSQFVHDGVVREFDFRQYLFSRQAQVQQSSAYIAGPLVNCRVSIVLLFLNVLSCILIEILLSPLSKS